MEIKGMITSILFEGENNFKILKLDRKVTIKGRFFFNIELGKDIICQGDYDEKGEFNINFAKEFFFTEELLIKEILVSGKIRYVGEKTAEKIVNEFKEKTFYVIEKKPKEIKELTNLSEQQVKEIQKSWIKIKKAKETIFSLIEVGLKGSIAIDLYNEYKNSSKNLFFSNPYIIFKINDSIDFKYIDDLAIYKLGIEPLGGLRIQESILYFLNKLHLKTGSTLVPIDLLVKTTYKVTNIDDKYIIKNLKSLISKKYIFKINKKDKNYIQDKVFYKAEKTISRFILKSLKKDNIIDFKINPTKEFSEKQKEALKKFNKNNISIIYGASNSGKTTVGRMIANTLKANNYKVCLLAYTGVIADSLSINNVEGSTIHRILEYDFVKKEFTYNEHNKLEHDVFIFDEFSMIDILTFEKIISAIPEKSKILLIGDVNKIGSVGPGDIFNDLTGSNKIAKTKFEKIFNTNSSPVIFKEISKIEDIKLEKILNQKDISFVQSKDETDSREKLKKILLKTEPKIIREKIQIISPLNNGGIGVNSINSMVKSIVNPSKYKNRKEHFDNRDKVVQVKNNYKKYILNGEIGFIFYKDDYIAKVNFSGKEIIYDKIDFNEISLSYCITVHKSQGYHYPYTIILLPEKSIKFLDIKLLITALSRARSKIIIIGSKNVLKEALENKDGNKRLTFLGDLLNQ